MKNTQNELLLSNLLANTRDCFNFHKTARFWFGALFPFSTNSNFSILNQDIKKQELLQLLSMLNYVASDLMIFYQKNPPEDAFRLLSLIKRVFEVGQSGYQLIVSQIYLNNTLALFLMKHGQFAHAHQCFEFILEVVVLDKIDPCSEILLSSLSNYLIFLKTHEMLQTKQTLTKVNQSLVQIYSKLATRYLSIGFQQPDILILFSVYKQHYVLFRGLYVEQNALLVHKFEQMRTKEKKKPHMLVPQESNSKIKGFLNRNTQHYKGELQIKKAELYFYTSSLLFSQKNKKNSSLDIYKSLELSRQLKPKPKYFKDFVKSSIQTTGAQQIFMTLSSKKKKQTELDNSTIQLLDSQPIFIKKQANSPKIKLRNHKLYSEVQTFSVKPVIVEPKGLSSIKSAIKSQIKLIEIKARVQKLNLKEHVYLKVGKCILQIMRDGLIISDYLNKRSRYLTWQQIGVLIRHLKFAQTFTHHLPIEHFYDLALILIPYIKTLSTGQPCITDTPSPMIQLDIFTKVYALKGKFVQVFKMNQFDNFHVEFVINCYMEEFDQYFQIVNEDEWIKQLNCKIFNEPYKSQNHCLIKSYRKQKQVSQTQIIQTLQLGEIEQFPYIKSSPFKLLMIMAKGIKLVIQLREKQANKTENQQNKNILNFIVIDVNDPLRKQKQLKLPLYRLGRYFPINYQDHSGMVKDYGEFIIEGFHRCFQDFPHSFNNLQYFNVKTYAKKVQMIPAGKYLTPITAQIIGSSTRIWGICLRYFEQSTVSEIVTFIYNPYHELLQSIPTLKPQERNRILLDHLIDGKLTTTYRKLQSLKLIGKRINLIAYWLIIDF